jgi:ATP-dependent Clp protease ATP-binding subunit ClpA
VLARIYLYIRPFPNGRVIVTPLKYPDLEADAPNVQHARGLVVQRLAHKVRSVSVDDRTALLHHYTAELVRTQADIRLDKRSEDRLPMMVGVALLKYTRDQPGPGQGTTYVAYPPAAPWFRAEGRDPDEVLGRVKERLEKALAKWVLDRGLMVEDPEGSFLEPLDIRLSLDAPRAEEPAGPGFLAEVGRELTADATRSSRGVDQREAIVTRALAALALPERSSVMLVGPRDVGKTALVHELARRLAAGQVPPELRGRELWEVTANELIAGAQYTGQWQARGRQLIEQAQARSAILAMGDPGGIVDAGKWSQSDNNLSRLLRPHMERGDLTLICECTPEALGAVRLLEPSFVDAFHRVDVSEPPIEETREILAAAGRRFHAAHAVRADEAALAAVVELTRRFEPYRSFPGKAVRLLEETGQAALAASATEVTRGDVVAAFTARTGLPLDLLLDEAPLTAGAVAEHFEARILGQPEAVRAMVDLIMVLKASLNDPGKPLGSFLFVGPTGVGKTELAKALAELLFGSRDRVVRLDMGEYATADAVQRLVGTRWGHQDEGELTKRVREQPFCVVLLDEIEKAHWQVFDALLGALGEGRLTDAAGRTTDLSSAIIVMTSNLGAEGQRSGTLGFASSAEAAEAAGRASAHYLRQAEQFFRPEFFNRIDRVLVFNPLDEEAIRRIARRELGRLLMREGILRRQLLVEVDEPAVFELAARGFHPRYGARPLQREIERAVISPLARRLVEQRPGPGDLVRVHLRAGEVVVDVRPVTVPAPEPVRPAPAERPPDGTLARAAEDAQALSKLVEREEAQPAVAALRAELSGLVAETQDPTFWDLPADARATLGRVYALQRLLDTLAELRARAQGLVELGRQLRQARDRSRLPTLRQAIEEIEGALELLRLELAGASLPARASVAHVRVTAVGHGAEDWADAVLTMYAAWAERTGREVAPVNGGGIVAISGPSSRDLLDSETGLHRRLGADGRPLHARVTVGAPDQPAPDEGSPVVVRIYDDRRRQVRDPRTGVSVKDPASVLRYGRIDPFLIAGIGLREPAAPEQPTRPVGRG